MYNNRTFAAGAGAIATNFFCLFGFIFLVTQYFQLVRGLLGALGWRAHVALRLRGHGDDAARCTRRASTRDSLRRYDRSALHGGRAVVDVVALIDRCLRRTHHRIDDHARRGILLGERTVSRGDHGYARCPNRSAAERPETRRRANWAARWALRSSVRSSRRSSDPTIRRAFAPFLGHGLSAAQITSAQSSMQAAKVSGEASSHRAASASGADKVTAAFMDGLHRACLVGGGDGRRRRDRRVSLPSRTVERSSRPNSFLSADPSALRQSKSPILISMEARRRPRRGENREISCSALHGSVRYSSSPERRRSDAGHQRDGRGQHHYGQVQRHGREARAVGVQG